MIILASDRFRRGDGGHTACEHDDFQEEEAGDGGGRDVSAALGEVCHVESTECGDDVDNATGHKVKSQLFAEENVGGLFFFL